MAFILVLLSFNNIHPRLAPLQKKPTDCEGKK